MGKKVYAIMGATGNIGHVLCQDLLKGNTVRAIGRNPKKLEELKNKGAEIVSINNFEDSKALAKAFQGCDGVFCMLPPSHETDNYNAYQDKVGEAICSALQTAKIHYAVNLSSVGAELSSPTGPINGIGRMEKRLAKLSDINVINLRAGYFMENLLNMIPGLKHLGVLASTVRHDLPIQMVATQDIGHKAAEFLMRLDFKGQTYFDFGGPRLVTMDDVSDILGKEIGKRGLKYVQADPKNAEQAMLAAGMKPDLVKLFLEMNVAFNNGTIKFTQNLTSDHKGKTTIEEFAKTFGQAFHGGLAHV